MSAKKSTGKKQMIQIRQTRSLIGSNDKQRETVRGLGLRRIGHVVERPDDAAIRGMVTKVRHLVEIVGEES
jgi:large subunit ribosomal protein L30